jgi:hypothetical protein
LRDQRRHPPQRGLLFGEPLDLGGPLGHLHLELVAGLAERFFCPLPLVDEADALERPAA